MGQQSNEQLLLTTRLTIPPVRSDLVARPRLTRSLEACMEHPLTLLAAPAGFGKTVLLSAWARQQQQLVGWVSLDSSDNDPAQFWTYVLAALDKLHPGLGAKPLSLLQSEQSAPIETVLVALTGSHRYIVDYLTEEVLGQQPQHIRTFLLQTSVLDRLNGPLCDAVIGQSNGQATLEQLEQANLFLLALDDERYWYRYHHLFAEALRFRLTQVYPDLLPTLHQRASVWFESHGFMLEAINHALASRDFDRAATLIEPGLYVANQRQWMHVSATERLTHYAVHPKRDKAALDAIGIVATFSGVSVHDGWSSYWQFGCQHALCNVHHLRELTYLDEEQQQVWAGQMKELLLDIKAAVAQARAEGRSHLHPLEVADWKARYQALLAEGYLANPPPDPPAEIGKKGRRKQSAARNLLDRLSKHQEALLLFLT